MATIKFEITVPDEKKTEILNDFAAYLGYKEILDGGAPNPQSKADFARAKVAEYVKNCFMAYRVGQATEDAREKKSKEVEAIPIS